MINKTLCQTAYCAYLLPSLPEQIKQTIFYPSKPRKDNGINQLWIPIMRTNTLTVSIFLAGTV